MIMMTVTVSDGNNNNVTTITVPIRITIRIMTTKYTSLQLTFKSNRVFKVQEINVGAKVSHKLLHQSDGSTNILRDSDL